MTEAPVDETTQAQGLTEAGTIVGTFPYMAPEQLSGEAADPRTDLWALGVMLYEMACGVLPFRGRTRFELTSAILSQPPPQLPPAVPPDLSAVIFRCLEKDPGRRYQQAAEIRAALEAVQSGSGVRVAPPAMRSRVAAGVVVLLVLAAIGIVVRDLLERQASIAAPAKSLAILPFTSLTSDGNQQFFVEGLHSAVIGEVAQIKSLRVISLTSAARYRDSKKSVPEIASELGVDHLVEGTITRAGDNIQAQIQLIEAAPLEKHLWSQRFEGTVSAVGSLRRDVARSIAVALGVPLTPGDQTRLTTSSRKVDREAYELYLRGMHHLNTFTPEGFKTGVTVLHQAVDRDPTDPQAWGALAVGYALIGHGSGAGSGPEGFAKARAAAQQALKLDDTVPEAHAAMAEVKAYLEWDWEGAKRAFERALELNPNSDEMHRHYAWLHLLHWRFDDAVREMKIAQEINPLRPVVFAEMGWLHLYNGDFDRAIAEAKKALDINPEARNAQFVLGVGYAGKRMFDKAIDAHSKLMAKVPNRRWDLAKTYAQAGRSREALALLDEYINDGNVDLLRPYRLARVYAALGDYDKAFQFAERSYKERNWTFPWIFHEKVFAEARKDPRYHELMRRVNVPVR